MDLLCVLLVHLGHMGTVGLAHYDGNASPLDALLATPTGVASLCAMLVYFTVLRVRQAVTQAGRTLLADSLNILQERSVRLITQRRAFKLLCRVYTPHRRDSVNHPLAFHALSLGVITVTYKPRRRLITVAFNLELADGSACHVGATSIRTSAVADARLVAGRVRSTMSATLDWLDQPDERLILLREEPAPADPLLGHAMLFYSTNLCAISDFMRRVHLMGLAVTPFDPIFGPMMSEDTEQVLTAADREAVAANREAVPFLFDIVALNPVAAFAAPAPPVLPAPAAPAALAPPAAAAPGTGLPLPFPVIEDGGIKRQRTGPE